MSEHRLLPCPFCGSDNIEIFANDGKQFAQCADCTACGPDHVNGRHWNSRHSDAHLVAAAPDLLASLRDVLETFSLGPLGAAAKYGPDADLRAIEEACVKNARAAIAKAEGSRNE